MSIEISIFEPATDGGSDKVLLGMQTSSPAIAAMNLRALAAELDKQAGTPEPVVHQRQPRKQRSDAGQARGPRTDVPAVSPFTAPVQP